MNLHWREFVRDYWELINRIELMALGGQVTYYMILSFFPLLILLLTLIGYADLSSEQFFEVLCFNTEQGIQYDNVFPFLTSFSHYYCTIHIILLHVNDSIPCYSPSRCT